MDVREIKSCMTRLEGAIVNKLSCDTITDILELLAKRVVATEAILRDTKLGLAIGRLRSHPNQDVSRISKQMVQKWRDDINESKRQKNKNNGSRDEPTEGEKAATEELGATPISKYEQRTSVNLERSVISDEMNIGTTGDNTRDACIKALYNALATESFVDGSLILNRARAIDLEMFSGSKKVDATYRNKMRSLVQNLKAQSNLALRQNVVEGKLSTSRLCSMTPKELASEERRAEDAKLEAVNIFNARGAKEQKAITDRFQCGKCKNRRVSYYQMQTRSADEPMTTFCEVH